MVKNLPAHAGDVGSVPGLGRSPGEGSGYPLQHSCLEKSHGQRSLAGPNSWGCKELDMTEPLTYTFLPYQKSLSLKNSDHLIWGVQVEGACLFLSPRLHRALAAYFFTVLARKPPVHCHFRSSTAERNSKGQRERQQLSVPLEENPLHLGSIMSAANFFPPANFEV